MALFSMRDSWNVWRRKVNAALGGLAEPVKAKDVTYDNTDSGLTATNVQSAIDEVNGDLGTLGTTVSGIGDITTAVHGNYISKGTIDVRVDKEGTDTWGALLDKLAVKALTQIQRLASDERVQILGITGTINLVVAYPSSFLSNSLSALSTFFIGSGIVTNGHTLTTATLTSSGSKLVTSTIQSNTQTFGSDRSAAEATASSYLVLRLNLFKKV